MSKSQEQDEFIAVRVQDPRVQNEGSWNSYVDFKIFLHTNSKAFTAKTSCVRRRYSEFVWLKKKLQKNAGLVPVPDLPKKSIFSFINDDFIERRRKGLQSFLDKVVHMTVCLSDSQLHLFLQTQLPVKHIEDCVQGHTPYTVTEAILNYASSNQGWVQEEEGGDQETGPVPVSYESVESPAPHLPSLQSPGATSSAPNQLSDVSNESRPSDAEPVASNLKLGIDHEQLSQDGESYVQLAVDVHPNLDDSVETDDKGLNTGSNYIDNDLQMYDCDVTPQMDGLHEDTPLPKEKCSEDNLEQDSISSEDVADNTSVDKVIERVSGDFTEAKEGSQCVEQHNTVKQTPDEDLEDNSRVKIDNNEVTPDEEDYAEHRMGNILEIEEDTAVHDACENSMVDNEGAITEITEDHTVHQNGVSDEDSSEEIAVQEKVLNESGEHVEEVNELKAKSFHPSNAILILDGIEEAVSTQTALMTETISKLDANTADVDTLVFEAIDIDSLQSQETDSHIIITTPQSDVC